MPCTSLVFITILLDALPDFFCSALLGVRFLLRCFDHYFASIFPTSTSTPYTSWQYFAASAYSTVPYLPIAHCDHTRSSGGYVHAPLVDLPGTWYVIPRCVLSQSRDSKCSPRFEVLFFSTRGRLSPLILPLSCLSASTSPWEGLPVRFLEDSLGRPQRRSMQSWRDVSTCMYARLLLILTFQKYENVVLLSGQMRASELAILIRAQRELFSRG